NRDSVFRSENESSGPSSVVSFSVKAPIRLGESSRRNVHPGPRSKIRKCPFCNYFSSRSNNVERHIKFRHTGEKPTPCPLCPRRFTLKQELESHMRVHTGEKPHQCRHCLFRFARKSQLKKHLLMKHGQQEQLPPDFNP
ncbi:UNVERIFIED_CONTAM: hypothetical protein GTU68_063146, partial [Idotea baltica]|nr:hypothetical protein [Idotea baltica]